jgi:hypothetical protein
VGTALELAVMHRRQKFLESKGHALHVAASNLGLAVPTSTAIAPAAASALPAAARYIQRLYVKVACHAGGC